MSNAIQIENLVKSYGSYRVLNDLTFQVKKGESFALLGTNGAGKTTALECIEGLRPYDSGKIILSGKIGIQLQTSSLPSHIRPMEAVNLFAKWNKVKPDPAMLEAFQIGKLAKKQYRELSAGQKRRLHLVLALLCNPDIVFLDEPTAGLDIEGRILLHQKIRECKAQGKTILLTSHDMAEVENLCDRIAILNGGAISFLGTVAQLSAKAGNYHTISVQTSLGEERHRTNDLGETLLALLQGYKQRGVKVKDIQIDRTSLEQDFIELTRRSGA